MHEKTAVSALIAEMYTFLRQADARELDQLFKKLDRDGNGHLTLSEFKNRNGIKGQ
jgi:isocitrate lyase